MQTDFNDKIENIESAIKILIDEVSKLSSNPKHIILTSKEVCELLKISSKTLAKYRNEGLLGFSKIGREIFYRLGDILQMLDDFRNEPFNRPKGKSRSP